MKSIFSLSASFLLFLPLLLLKPFQYTNYVGSFERQTSQTIFTSFKIFCCLLFSIDFFANTNFFPPVTVFALLMTLDKSVCVCVCVRETWTFFNLIIYYQFFCVDLCLLLFYLLIKYSNEIVKWRKKKTFFWLLSFHAHSHVLCVSAFFFRISILCAENTIFLLLLKSLTIYRNIWRVTNKKLQKINNVNSKSFCECFFHLRQV